MPSALSTREKGLAKANIAQSFKSSGVMLTCRKDVGVTVLNQGFNVDPLLQGQAVCGSTMT